MVIKKRPCGGEADLEGFVLGKENLPPKKKQGEKGRWKMPGLRATWFWWRQMGWGGSHRTLALGDSNPCLSAGPLEEAPEAGVCSLGFPGGGPRHKGISFLVLISPAASVPEASAGSLGRGNRQIVNEEAQFKWAEGTEGKGERWRPQQPSLSPPPKARLRSRSAHPCNLLPGHPSASFY